MTAAVDVTVDRGIIIRWRRGPGPTVCWVHGYTMDSTVWDELWDQLPQWNHMAIDLPGHGGSRPLTATDTLPSVGATLGAIAADAGAEHLVALSFGTIVALQMAMEHPTGFRTVTLASPAFGGGPTDGDVAARYVEMGRHHAVHGADEGLVDLWMQHPPGIFAGIARHPEAAARLRSVITRHRWEELSDGHLFGLVRYPQTALDLSALPFRTLILVGEHDLASTVRSAEILSGRLPEVTTETVAGAGHLPLLETPVTVAPLLANHIERGQP